MNKRGLGFMISIGGYGGFNYQCNKLFWRVCLGWVSVALFFHDVDPCMAQWYKEHIRIIK